MTPTALSTGSGSPPWPKDATAALHDALPMSRVVELDGQGPVAMNTAPELFVETLLAFSREME